MIQAKENKMSLVYDLLDLAILPAALLICVKAVGMAALNYYLNLSWELHTYSNSFFSLKPTYINVSDILLVNSYTNLFLFICVSVGCMVVTSKALLFHSRKASPFFVLKLARYDLLHLLRSSMHLYKETFVWALFLILTTTYISISFLLGETYSWIAGISVLFCITFIWIIIQNIEEDILFHSYK